MDAALGFRHIIHVLISMKQLKWATQLVEQRLQQFVDPSNRFPVEFKILQEKLKGELFKRAAVHALVDPDQKRNELQNTTHLSFKLASVHNNPDATVEDVYLLWEKLGKRTARQPGNAVDAARSLSIIELRTLGTVSRTEKFIETTAAETGFTRDTFYPLLRILIASFAKVGDADSAFRVFRDSMAQPGASPRPVLRAFEDVLLAITKDSTKNSAQRDEMLNQAAKIAEGFGSFFNRRTLELIMEIHFSQRHFDDIIFLYRKFVDTVPPPPLQYADFVPEVVPLVDPSAVIGNWTMKALISTMEEHPERRTYALTIFRRMVLCAEAMTRNKGLDQRIHDMYWRSNRTLELAELMVEVTKELAQAAVLPTKFPEAWEMQRGQNMHPSQWNVYEVPDDDPWRSAFPRMSPNQESFDIVLHIVREPGEADLVLEGLKLLKDIRLTPSQLQLLGVLSRKPTAAAAAPTDPDESAGPAETKQSLGESDKELDIPKSHK